MDDEALELKLQALREKAREHNAIRCANGFCLGDQVRINNVRGIFTVIDVADPSLVGLLAPSGRIARCGWRALTRVKDSADART